MMVGTNGQEGPPSTEVDTNAEASTDQITAAQNAAVIETPEAGQDIAVDLSEAAALQLRFDPTGVQITQAGDELLMDFPNGGQVAVQDFPGNLSEVPQVILPDGTAVAGEVFAQQFQNLLTQPPLQTTAGAPGSALGGGSTAYLGDLGRLLSGFQSSAIDGESLPAFNTSFPGNGPAALFGEGGTDDTSLALNDEAPSRPLPFAATFVPPENPVGPGAEESLFSRQADTVDLNAIDVGGYEDGTQYHADRGDDTVTLAANAREAIEVGFDAGRLFDAGPGHDEVTGGSLADLVEGNRGNDTLLGGVGDDTLLGSQGNDSLLGGANDDLLDGGHNNDILLGGIGEDLLIGGSGRDTLDGGLGEDLLRGGGGNDSLLGGANDDLLYGDGGRDTLEGGLGADLLEGGNSNDLLLGGVGDDTLTGGSGRDTLEGGLGDDVMTGGGSRDVFSFSLAENQGDDVILDFRAANNGDRLEIADVLDVNGDSSIDIADLDAGGHTVSGNADSVVISFEQGGSLTLQGIDGSGVNSFADLLDIKVNIDIV